MWQLTMYVQLRHDLAKLFMWGRCADPEGMTDETFDRVAKKVHELRPSVRRRSATLFSCGSEQSHQRELSKKLKLKVSLEDVDLPGAADNEIEEEIVADTKNCLQIVLAKARQSRNES